MRLGLDDWPGILRDFYINWCPYKYRKEHDIISDKCSSQYIGDVSDLTKRLPDLKFDPNNSVMKPVSTFTSEI